jgi:rfaE bifunctional protein kinase chain/domain
MRIMAGKQQLLRVDTERTDPIGEDIATRLTEESIGRLLDTGIDAVILQDYNKGVLTEAVIEAVMRKCKATHTLVAVDPKFDNFFAYRGATLFKPNLKETREALNIHIEPEADSLLKAADLLREKLGCRDVMITLSEKGIFYQSGHETDIVATRARTIADVSGAGDTVISVATLALAAGMSLGAAARLANMAAGLVCEQPGVVAVDAERLEYSVRSSQLGAGGFEF